jgi:hypothetical protein
MNNSVSDREVSPTAKRAVHSWVQGLLLGVCIGAAFIGGWMLARGGGSGDKPDSGEREFAAMASDPVRLTVNAPVDLIAEPRGTAPLPVSATPVAAGQPGVAPVPSPEARPPVASPAAPVVPELIEPARLVIATEPGTRVFLQEGKERRLLGVADKSGALSVVERNQVAEKRVDLSFEHPDCVNESRAGVPLHAGRAANVVVPLRYRPGVLTIIAEPVTAEVVLNGEPRGRGVVVVGEVASRVPHSVEVRARNSHPVKRVIVVSPNSTVIERISLSPAELEHGDILFLGGMRALSAQEGVSVLLDGRPVAVEQGLVRNVIPGEYLLAIVRAPLSEGGAAQTLWERKVRIEPGSATSLDDGDSAASGVDEKNLARLALILLDGKGRAPVASGTKVFFEGAELTALKNGSWPLPVGREGTLRVVAPGFVPAERTVHFAAPGEYSISCVLQAVSAVAPVAPLPEKWVVRVAGVSADNGLLVINDVSGHPVVSGQLLVLTPQGQSGPGAAANAVRLSVIEAKGGLVVCQILPGRAKMILPERGMDAVVTVGTVPPPHAISP